MLENIIPPSAKEIRAIEGLLKGDRLELFQETFDVMHEIKNVENEPGLDWRVKNLHCLLKGFERTEKSRSVFPPGTLYIKSIEPDGIIDLGLASIEIVTTVGGEFLIDAFQKITDVGDMEWHASGTGAVAPVIGNTVLGTEVGTRIAGTPGEDTSLVYQSIATLSYGSGFTITEHGLFSASTAGVLFDRHTFAGKGVDTNTSLEFTFKYTYTVGL